MQFILATVRKSSLFQLGGRAIVHISIGWWLFDSEKLRAVIMYWSFCNIHQPVHCKVCTHVMCVTMTTVGKNITASWLPTDYENHLTTGTKRILPIMHNYTMLASVITLETPFLPTKGLHQAEGWNKISNAQSSFDYTLKCIPWSKAFALGSQKHSRTPRASQIVGNRKGKNWTFSNYTWVFTVWIPRCPETPFSRRPWFFSLIYNWVYALPVPQIPSE